MKVKKLMMWMLPLLMLPSVHGMAQTNIIDYSSWLGTSSCNAFGTSTSIGGVIHKSTLGQPKYVDYNDPIVLECIPVDFNNFDPKGTEYAISHTFLANHQYKVTVYCASVSTTFDPKLVLTYTNSASSSTACNGPVVDQDPNANGFTISGPYYYDYVYTNTIGAQAQNYLKFRAIAAYGGSTLQKIVISKIIIEDVTPVGPPPPTFSITSSVASRTCGTASLNPITFTVNSQNASNITGYDYIVEPFQWTMGVPATVITNTIHQASNTISLTPYECGSGSTLTVIPYINSIAQSPVTKTITINTSGIRISGPSSLPSIGALYDLKSSELVFPAPPPNLVCGATPYWSIDNTDLGQLTVNSTYNVGLQKNPNTFVTSGTVILKAGVMQCGISTTATKSVTITSPISPINSSPSGLGKIFGESESVTVTPNPSNGIFNLRFASSLDKAKLSIMSIDGKEIFNTEVSGSGKSVDLSASPAGIYLLKVNTGRTIETKKLVITR